MKLIVFFCLFKYLPSLKIKTNSKLKYMLKTLTETATVTVTVITTSGNIKLQISLKYIPLKQ